MLQHRISAYLTTIDCWDAGVPFEAAIHSMLGFCFELVIVDAGSKDGTWERLRELAAEEPRIRLLRCPIDKDRPGWALDMELRLKARARRECRGHYCWQADPDEIVTADDWRKVSYCLEYLSPQNPVLALPILEYWGGIGQVRRDLYPATPKLSLNLPAITHGLPRGFGAQDRAGLPYALAYASLSTSFVDKRTGEFADSWSMIPAEVEALRETKNASERYEGEFYDCLDDLPVVHHFAWVAIERKLRQLRDYCSRFHASFYGLRGPVSAWPLFDSTWEHVTDAAIVERAKELREQGPGLLSGESEFPTLMTAKKELPADIRRWLASRRLARAVVTSPVL